MRAWVRKKLGHLAPEAHPQWVTLSQMGELLQGDDELYDEGEFSPERVLLLVRHGYLKFWQGDETKIAHPGGYAIRWLRLMLLPLPQRPLFTLTEVAEMAQMMSPKGDRAEGLPLLRKICASYVISIHVDEAFGELLSPQGFIRLLDTLFGYREPMRFDRVALVEWMRGLKTGQRLRSNLPYSRLLELEIRRIARLKEPERTMRAVALWESYYDAKRVANCLANYRRRVKREMMRTEGQLGRLMKRLTSQDILLPAFPEEPPSPGAPPPSPPRPLPPPAQPPRCEPTS